MNEPAIGKRYWPTAVLVLVTAAALAACLLFAGYLYLPELVTDRLPVAQIRSLGFADFTGRITRIGCSGRRRGRLFSVTPTSRRSPLVPSSSTTGPESCTKRKFAAFASAM